jgi:hypothetical protein
MALLRPQRGGNCKPGIGAGAMRFVLPLPVLAGRGEESRAERVGISDPLGPPAGGRPGHLVIAQSRKRLRPIESDSIRY